MPHLSRLFSTAETRPTCDRHEVEYLRRTHLGYLLRNGIDVSRLSPILGSPQIDFRRPSCQRALHAWLVTADDLIAGRATVA